MDVDESYITTESIQIREMIVDGCYNVRQTVKYDLHGPRACY